MSKSIATHIATKHGYPDLIKLLAQDLNGADFNSLLLEVFSRRLEQITPPALLKQYEANRLVKPASVNVIRLKEQELDVLKLWNSLGFEPVELAPVAQLGSCSVVATAAQQKILSALRNSEVQADPTNALALHYAYLKKTKRLQTACRFTSIIRLLRTGALKNPAHTPHFSMACLVTADRDKGNFEFEQKALLQHFNAHAQLLAKNYGITDISFSIIPLNGYKNGESLLAACTNYLKTQGFAFKTTIAAKNEMQNYYKGLQFKTYMTLKGETIEIGDGGLVDWTQQLLGNTKERLFTSAIGVQLLHYLSN